MHGTTTIGSNYSLLHTYYVHGTLHTHYPITFSQQPYEPRKLPFYRCKTEAQGPHRDGKEVKPGFTTRLPGLPKRRGASALSVLQQQLLGRPQRK